MTKMRKDAISLDKIMLVLVLFTEMFVGGVTWMYATDYSRYLTFDKRSHSIEAVKQHISSSATNENLVLAKIKEIEEKIEDLRQENHELHNVAGSIKTEKEIDDIISLIVDNETNMALAYLWSKK